MPLKPGTDAEVIQQNIRELIRSGRSQRQATAIALDFAKQSKETTKKKTRKRKSKDVWNEYT